MIYTQQIQTLYEQIKVDTLALQYADGQAYIKAANNLVDDIKKFNKMVDNWQLPLL